MSEAARTDDADDRQRGAAARRRGGRRQEPCASSASGCRRPPPTSPAGCIRSRPVLIYESGCIGSKPTRLPLSIGDGELAETADAVVSVPEIFAYWLQAGRIDIGFLGGAQLDRFGNINSTVIGAYDQPKTRLPGAGGAPEIAASAGAVMVIMRQIGAGLRRALRLPHLGRLRRRSRRSRAARPARSRSAARHHRPRRAGARPGHVRARARRAPSRRDAGAMRGGDGLAIANSRRSDLHRADHRQRARCARRDACGLTREMP